MPFGPCIISACLATNAGCGSEVVFQETGTSSQGAGSAAGSGGATSSGGAGAGIPEHCLSPSGFQLCGGESGCPIELCEVGCFRGEFPKPGLVSICGNDATLDSEVFGTNCQMSPDGAICFKAFENHRSMLSAPFEVGKLLDSVGAGEQVYYADFSRWTGASLPEPTDCPSTSGFQLCGPGCAACPGDEFCHGRSPHHPYGLCIPEHVAGEDGFFCSTTGSVCDANQKCFIFLVPPQQQQFADSYGYCMDPARCDAAAKGYPGGAKCIAAVP